LVEVHCLKYINYVPDKITHLLFVDYAFDTINNIVMASSLLPLTQTDSMDWNTTPVGHIEELPQLFLGIYYTSATFAYLPSYRRLLI